MDKKVRLIFEFQTAPESLKNAAKAFNQAEIKLTKAKAAQRAAENATKDADAVLKESQAAFEAELNAWKPAVT